MGKRKINMAFLMLLVLLMTGIIGCGKAKSNKENLCHIVMEAGDGYRIEKSVRTVKYGSDVNLEVTVEDDWELLGTDYHGETEISEMNNGKVKIVLRDVRYSESICIQAEKGKYEIVYDSNGGTDILSKSDRMSICYRGTHQRINTSIGTDIFSRDGYTLIGWNTRADGSGEAVGLGSRVKWKKGLVLYAQWRQWSPEEEFIYTKEGDFVEITGYTGKRQEICIPAVIGGLPVRTVKEQAFADADCRTVILPPGIYEIEKWAFRGCCLEQMYFYDDLVKVSDYAFQDCDHLSTIHINAIEAPAYSGNYFDTFQDKYDRLLSMKDKKKIVLFSGSSTRFGYDSERIDRAFPDYEVVNMGVFAYSPALPQLELILSCMKEGDILLDSPEFDAANRQFCYQRELDYAVFAMMESNYDVFAQLDIREYTQVFTAFTAYQVARQDMERKDYDVSASEYDEDGNEVDNPSYNEYGDYVIYRPNSDKEAPIYGLPVNYTVNAFPKETLVDSMNKEFEKFLDRGIKVYFTYSPRNKYALSRESTPEERVRLDEYFKQNLKIPVISELEDSLYAGTYLYGTDNHLSTEGVQIRTEKVIRDLKEQLAKEGEK